MGERILRSKCSFTQPLNGKAHPHPNESVRRDRFWTEDVIQRSNSRGVRRDPFKARDAALEWTAFEQKLTVQLKTCQRNELNSRIQCAECWLHFYLYSFICTVAKKTPVKIAPHFSRWHSHYNSHHSLPAQYNCLTISVLDVSGHMLCSSVCQYLIWHTTVQRRAQRLLLIYCGETEQRCLSLCIYFLIDSRLVFTVCRRYFTVVCAVCRERITQVYDIFLHVMKEWLAETAFILAGDVMNPWVTAKVHVP